MSHDKEEVEELLKDLNSLCTRKFTIEQRVSHHGIYGKRKGMMYISMPKDAIGKLYKITLELIEEDRMENKSKAVNQSDGGLAMRKCCPCCGSLMKFTMYGIYCQECGASLDSIKQVMRRAAPVDETSGYCCAKCGLHRLTLIDFAPCRDDEDLLCLDCAGFAPPTCGPQGDLLNGQRTRNNWEVER